MERPRKHAKHHGSNAPETDGVGAQPPEWPSGRLSGPPANGRTRPPPALDLFVRTRIENLGLLEAIRSEIDDLQSIAGLAGEVRDLEQFDRMIALGIHVMELEGDPFSSRDGAHRDRLLEIGATLRGEVRALLPWKTRARVQRASAARGVSTADVWADVRRLRQSGRCVSLHPAFPGPVPRQQRIPESADPGSWLARLTLPWLRTVAAQHGAVTSTRRRPLVRRIAAALKDAEHVEDVLARRLNADERGLLARYTACTVTQRVLLSDADESDLASDWDGNGDVPARPGARLRTFGLIYLGWLDEATEVVMQPENLRHLLARHLLLHHESDLAGLSSNGWRSLEEIAATRAWGA